MPPVPGQTSSSALLALGLTADEERLYHRLTPFTGHTVEGVASLMQVKPGELEERTRRLVEMGLLGFDGGRLEVAVLAEAVSRLVRREAGRATAGAARLEQLARAVPHLVAASVRPDRDDVDDVRPLDGELSTGGQAVHLLREMMRNSEGDMLWLRPDTWSIRPREEAVNKLLAAEVARGRRSRAIYPVRALTVDPDALRARARAGEEVRVVSDVPTRMFILGASHAVLPEPLGMSDDPRVHVRQRSLVAALTHWFEALWETAQPVPGLQESGARPDLRRFLLEQMAAGSTDEVIARRLGIGLRTVRRRVAAMMAELGADSRFQAGVEAVRRGWL
jgi:DNA-binding CsgD family transcriptional regulator